MRFSCAVARVTSPARLPTTALILVDRTASAAMARESAVRTCVEMDVLTEVDSDVCELLSVVCRLLSVTTALDTVLTLDCTALSAALARDTSTLRFVVSRDSALVARVVSLAIDVDRVPSIAVRDDASDTTEAATVAMDDRELEMSAVCTRMVDAAAAILDALVLMLVDKPSVRVLRAACPDVKVEMETETDDPTETASVLTAADTDAVAATPLDSDASSDVTLTVLAAAVSPTERVMSRPSPTVSFRPYEGDSIMLGTTAKSQYVTHCAAEHKYKMSYHSPCRLVLACLRSQAGMCR